GKSTIYWALYTLLQSSKKDDDKIKQYFIHSTDTTPNHSSLVNLYAEEDESKVELFVDEEREKLIISKNEITIKDDTNLIEDTLSTSDFINYKYLFRFFNFLHKDDIDLFELFEYEILHLVGLAELWKEIVELAEKKPRIIADKEDYKTLNTQLKKFNSDLENIVSNINEPTNSYLERFNYPNLKLILSIDEGKYSSQVFTKPKIKVALSILKDGNYEPIIRPQSYFNEAKLTAIALSVRLAVTKIKLKDSPLKILVLDDLLVSLDMSNRDKVLDIIVDDDILKEYQKIILTHDKAFFEMAKQKFNYVEKNKWKYFEMYVDIDSTKNIEIPYIKQYGQKYGNIAIAKEHFDNKDFPASANYLRKEVEKQFDEFLRIDNLEEKIKLSKLKENEQLIWDIQKDLKKLLRVLKQFENCELMPKVIQAQKCKEFSEQVISSITSITTYIEDDFHFEEFEDVKMILKSILHPQSHNDLTRPLYKKELEDAIELVEAFDTILNGE
ncbi:MAG: hypothetical protein KAI79_17375, partial [Bacteroidales bacterium]|nr:hypothetical protein [Bacteroidales bacterium]